MPQKKPYWLRLSIIPLMCLLFIDSTNAQDSLKFQQRKKFIIVANSLAYSSLMVGLNELWYKDYPRSKFHLFNDNNQWLQMDKFGHLYACYYEGLAGIEMMKWAGYSKKEYSLIGGAYGLFIQTGVEIFDGFSEEWGASPGDMTANIIGAGLAMSQSYFWDEQRCIIKYSYTSSNYPKYRPEVLGKSHIEQLIKDYNGQTYWLSCNVKSFISETNWPSWLNIAIGYGADGMIGGNNNIFRRDGLVYDYTSIHRKRQFYLSPDIDLSRIQSKNKVVKSLLIILNSLKFPMPTIEYNTESGLEGHWIKF